MKRNNLILPGIILCSIIFVLVFNPSLRASADGDPGPSPWGEILNPDGSVNWANLTYLGDVSQPADWMHVELSGGIQVPLGDTHYGRYLTPSGNVLVLPSPATMLMTFLHPQESGFAANTPKTLGSGQEILAALATDYIDAADLRKLGYVDPADFFRAVIAGRENLWSAVSPSFLIDVTRMSLDSGFLVNALWLYLNGADCSAIPGGCPSGTGLTLTPAPGGPEGTPPPPASLHCPPPTVATDPITGSGEEVAPPKPVVVGQDPEKRGVDVELHVSIPPVIFTWYEARLSRVCRYSAGGSGGGCSGPGNRYDRVTGPNGGRTSWRASMQNSPNWDASSDIECIQHVEVFPDYLDAAALSVSLSAESRGWIMTDLAQAYPGAHLKRPDWHFSFHGPGSASGNSAVSWSQLIPGIPLADPGNYHMQLSGRTTGTPVSAPRPFDLPAADFKVDLLRVSLIEAP